MNPIGKIKHTNVLLLQGPIGFFFKRLDKQLRKAGANTFRIGLNMGDQLFSCSDNYIPYRGKQDDWGMFIQTFLKNKNIKTIFLFGDCRFYQSAAIKIANTLKIAVYVFEEGYIRPDYITLERHGVNDYSHLPRTPEFYHALTLKNTKKPTDATPNAIINWGIVIVYYWMAKLFHFRYIHYKHHREYSASKELFFGLRSLTRKVIYAQRDKKYLSLLKGTLSKKYFFIPLQTYNDFQILQHSRYGSLEKFIIEVLESFSKYASKEDTLLFKHHPLDRGRKDYRKFIYEQAIFLDIKDKVLVLHDIHLPTCLQHAKGTVTINSTVGLSSIYHGTPTLTLGYAVYNIEGLTCKHLSLDKFWTTYRAPNEVLFKKYRQYIIEKTQLNGSFYGLFPKELQF